MTNTKTQTDDLDDFVGEPDAPSAPKQAEVEWNGRRTRIRLEHPILRGTPDSPAGRFLDGASKCADCGQEGHQFHAQATKTPQGWIGPESDHVQLLQDGGWLAGTLEARERAQRQRRRDEMIGPEASPVLSAAELGRLWKFELVDGHVNPAIESGLRRDEAEQLRRAVQAGLGDLAETLRDLVKSK